MRKTSSQMVFLNSLLSSERVTYLKKLIQFCSLVKSLDNARYGLSHIFKAVREFFSSYWMSVYFYMTLSIGQHQM